MTYKDGTFYSGEWMNEKRNGEGIQKYKNDSEREFYDGSWKNDFEDGAGYLVYKNGDKYEGSFVQGLREGKGVLNFGDNNANNRLSYEGEWLKDIISGNGTMKWKDGSIYVGAFENNLKHGQGFYTYPADDNEGLASYDGEWKKGLPSGFGTLIYKEKGKQYIGQWLNNYKQGYGLMTFGEESEILKYEGEFKGDERSGNGTMVWKNGQKYVGEWLNNEIHGCGILTYAADNPLGIESYSGDFIEGKPEGNGTEVLKSGITYVGQWLNGLYHGQGELFGVSPNNPELRISYNGNWKEGRRSGKGTLEVPTVGKYVGDWNDGRMEGNGTFSWSNGDKYEGEWKDDRLMWMRCYDEQGNTIQCPK